MTNRERERRTLSFSEVGGRGSVQETFFPWTMTVDRFREEGLPKSIADAVLHPNYEHVKDGLNLEKYFHVNWGGGVLAFENYFGFDPVRRICMGLPYRRNGEKITCADDWKRMKEDAERELELYFTDANIKAAFEPLREAHARGDFSLRMHFEGFFWCPRELLGIERHLFAFYDEPELLRDINEYTLQIYLKNLSKILDILPVDVIFLNEDLSGKNGPMLSPPLFDEFVGSYYKRLFPMLKEKGVGAVFTDTDGDFKQLIPNFLKAGVDGFVPMDVNAGMDIVAVRREFPQLKFIGGYNKLCIAEGKDAIDAEFDRIRPVIEGGGYIPGADHQVAPSTSLENYKYYVAKLTEVMTTWRA